MSDEILSASLQLKLDTEFFTPAKKIKTDLPKPSIKKTTEVKNDSIFGDVDLSLIENHCNLIPMPNKETSLPKSQSTVTSTPKRTDVLTPNYKNKQPNENAKTAGGTGPLAQKLMQR